MNDDLLNGSRFIKRIIRPPRIAIVINSIKDTEKFISIASLSWGGRYFLAIPCDNEGKINDDWFNVIEKYNPDFIKTFYDLSFETREKLWKSRFVNFKINKPEEINVEFLHNDPTKAKWIPEFLGQPLINQMMLDDFYKDDKNNGHKLTYIPVPSDFNLYYKARYGVIDEGEWARWQQIYISEPYRKNNPNELIENAELSPDQDVLFYLHQNRNKVGMGENLSLIDYTLRRLGVTRLNYFSIEDLSKSETSNIVIISEEENVEDFCWFWALRGQRYDPYDIYSKGPIWISQKSLDQNFNLINDLFINRGIVYLISKSIPKDNLPKLGEMWITQTDKLQEFYNQIFYIGDTTDLPVNFVNNSAEYKFETPESFKYINPKYNQFGIMEMQIPGITFPKFDHFNYKGFTFTKDWATRSGLAQYVQFAEEELKKIIVPTPMEVISTYADMVGYKVENSDKGNIADELLLLIGGIKNLWIISHPAIIDLLLRMSNVTKINNIKNLIRENVKDEKIRKEIISSLPRKSLQREIMPFSEIKGLLKTGDKSQKLDEKSSRLIIEWLLDKDFIRQGKTIKCKKCFTNNWIPVDKFNSRIICDGCLNEIKNPFSIEKIEWDYEINTLVSAEIDQGILVHLLTGFYILDETNSSSFSGINIYGSYYGLKFTKTGKENEIDVAFIVKGQLLIGECKVSGKEFTPKIIQDMIDFGEEIKASKIIFSCIAHKEELENSIKEFPSNKGIEFIILGGDDLSIQFPGIHILKQMHDEEKREKPFDVLSAYKGSLETINDHKYKN